MEYTYDPSKIKGRGKDQMRFELGDTSVGGGEETCALADEEYSAILANVGPSKKAWLTAKLSVLEAILFKLSYQVDTKIDVLSYSLGKRAEHWQKLYEQVRKQLVANSGAPTMADNAANKPPYFYGGMEENQRSLLPGLGSSPYRRTT